MVNARIGFCFALAVGCALGCMLIGCTLEGKTDPLDTQAMARRAGDAQAERAHLEQELRREETHVKQLAASIEKARVREGTLARETDDTKARVAASEKSLAALQAQAAGLDQKIQEEQKVVQGKGAELDAARTPQDRAALEARIAALKAEVERLSAELAKLPPPAPSAPAPEPAPATPPAPPPAQGGGGSPALSSR